MTGEGQMKYLYGAAVQGIQGFIFQTNQLQEIVGASDLVEQICTTAFDEYAENCGKTIVRAAGNIKHIFESEEACKEAVLNFPRKVMEMAPGITVSQAVVVYSGNDFANAVDTLESNLRTQRNKPMKSLTQGLLGVLPSRQTGLPVVDTVIDKNDKEKKILHLDQAAKKKLESYKTEKGVTPKLCKINFGEGVNSNKIAFDIEKITGDNDWIAIVHIDGNGLGQIVQTVGKDSDKFSEFSQGLDNKTKSAAQEAYNKVKTMFNPDATIPMRPVVLSGDDHTIICRADIAIPYTKAFLEAFEKESESIINADFKEEPYKIQFNNLTACAGIVFMKSKYPFYYGVALAETLCRRAKIDAKADARLLNGLAQSCLMFHKVQDSFVEDFDKIVARELSPQKDLSFEFGPYYLKEVELRWTIDHLIKTAKELSDSTKRHLRDWLTIIHKDKNLAERKIDRLIQQSTDEANTIKTLTTSVPAETEMTTNSKQPTPRVPVYDILVLDTINTQNTKK